MPGKIPDIVRLYRIIHVDNTEYLFTHGMFTRQHAKADPNYINIGDTDLIGKRSNYPVKINPPNGVLGDYIPFILGHYRRCFLILKQDTEGLQNGRKVILYISCAELMRL